jgi:hypothetical protein
MWVRAQLMNSTGTRPPERVRGSGARVERAFGSWAGVLRAGHFARGAIFSIVFWISASMYGGL